MRRCSLRSFAKINLDLRVLHKRDERFHELRTVFQTVSLADRLQIEFTPGRRTNISVEGADIPDNLVVRAAHAVLETARVTGTIRFVLEKKIPMGGGLGGGSSNAAAVLLALPVLAGVRLEMDRLNLLACSLGSDVPFFLQGGLAVGVGRGTELFPLSASIRKSGLIATSGTKVSTPDAYKALNRELTTPGVETDTSGFQSFVWGIEEDQPDRQWERFCINDFERPVFQIHSQLKLIRNRLRGTGASPAMMTGSGSAVFGLYEQKQQALAASAALGSWAVSKGIEIHLVSLIDRRRYRAIWRGQLKEHISGNIWPLPSRYSKE